MNPLPETILQFGSGKFLRAFADLFIHQANQEGQAVGRVVVAQSTGDQRANLLNQQNGRYHVLVRGLANGKTIERREEVACIRRALVAASQWPEILTVARSPALRYIISNTAEAGYTLEPADQPDGAPPRSFPAKLLLILKERFQAGLPGVTIVPCELFEGNADLLRGLLVKLAESWQLPPALGQWMKTKCTWHNSLVDRIVCVQPVTDPDLARDALVAVAEPYALWAIEDRDGTGDFFRHSAIRRAPDIRPFFLRKVRILNAAHTALVEKAPSRGIATVREAVLDPDIGAWLNRLLFEEIVPTLEDRVEDASGFAHQTLERFRNPFLEHKIADIAVYHSEKVKIRLLPTRAEYVVKFGRRPVLLDEAIAAGS